ncbi:MAG: cysteine--tRNA ligase, partial [Elioraea sp.]|nr:cysteine--tRNA ligase [Elioraea sp.]
MEIRLHNTLSRSLERFEPLDPGRVTLYVCGPTVYNYAHIGNARPYVVFGLLARLLRRRYPRVVYARNITDVDDKINAAALAAGLPISAITERYTATFHEDMAALGADPPDVEPRATRHIPEIIAMIRALLARGHAYEAEGHVLFSVASFPEYGRLSGRSLEEMIAGARVEVAPFKRHPADFVLWKPSPPEL